MEGWLTGRDKDDKRNEKKEVQRAETIVHARVGLPAWHSQKNMPRNNVSKGGFGATKKAEFKKQFSFKIYRCDSSLYSPTVKR